MKGLFRKQPLRVIVAVALIASIAIILISGLQNENHEQELEIAERDARRAGIPLTWDEFHAKWKSPHGAELATQMNGWTSPISGLDTIHHFDLPYRAKIGGYAQLSNMKWKLRLEDLWANHRKELNDTANLAKCQQLRLRSSQLNDPRGAEQIQTKLGNAIKLLAAGAIAAEMNGELNEATRLIECGFKIAKLIDQEPDNESLLLALESRAILLDTVVALAKKNTNNKEWLQRIKSIMESATPITSTAVALDCSIVRNNLLMAKLSQSSADDRNAVLYGRFDHQSFPASSRSTRMFGVSRGEVLVRGFFITSNAIESVRASYLSEVTSLHINHDWSTIVPNTLYIVQRAWEKANNQESDLALTYILVDDFVRASTKLGKINNDHRWAIDEINALIEVQSQKKMIK